MNHSHETMEKARLNLVVAKAETVKLELAYKMMERENEMEIFRSRIQEYQKNASEVEELLKNPDLSSKDKIRTKLQKSKIETATMEAEVSIIEKEEDIERMRTHSDLQNNVIAESKEELSKLN